MAEKGNWTLVHETEKDEDIALIKHGDHLRPGDVLSLVPTGSDKVSGAYRVTTVLWQHESIEPHVLTDDTEREEPITLPSWHTVFVVPIHVGEAAPVQSFSMEMGGERMVFRSPAAED